MSGINDKSTSLQLPYTPHMCESSVWRVARHVAQRRQRNKTTSNTPRPRLVATGIAEKIRVETLKNPLAPQLAIPIQSRERQQYLPAQIHLGNHPHMTNVKRQQETAIGLFVVRTRIAVHTWKLKQPCS